LLGKNDACKNNRSEDDYQFSVALLTLVKMVENSKQQAISYFLLNK